MSTTILKIDINSGNDAFQDCNSSEETVRILMKYAETLRARGSFMEGDTPLYDINGNKVGLAQYMVEDS